MSGCYRDGHCHCLAAKFGKVIQRVQEPVRQRHPGYAPAEHQQRKVIRA